MRLDQYMATYWPEYSRSVWQKYIELGLVMVNDVPETSVRRMIGEDDQVTIDALPVVDMTDYTLPVVYEDDHIVVINKPSGTLTHGKSEFREEPTVADFVEARMGEHDASLRPGIVHRLDRNTSGIIIAAKDDAAKKLLMNQFQERKAKKTYIAIVSGTPKIPEAMIDLPIGRNPKIPSSFRVDAKGKSAQTHYKVLGSKAGRSVIELKPITGRTHQLRVHLAHLGTPIVGDTLYDGKKSPIGRMCLHAQSLEITIPGSVRKTFTAPLPPDMQELVDDICA